MGICDFSSQAIKHHMLVLKKKKTLSQRVFGPTGLYMVSLFDR